MSTFMNIAHRGFSGRYPENTLLSFQKALDLGMTWVEFDLQVTRDGHLVVVHDRTVDRTTNGTGAVSDLTLAEVRALDAGARFCAEFAGERAPTFEETIDLLAPHARMVIELKFEGNGPIARVVQILQGRGAMARAVISSFDLAKLPEVRSLAPALPTTALVRLGDKGVAQLIAEVRGSGADTLGILCTDTTAELVTHARAAGLAVRAWGLKQDRGPEMERLIDLGIDGMTTDHPDVLQAVLKRRGMI